MAEKNGFFITFEGPEGAGKSSQVEALAAYLTDRGHDCLLTREPGGTPLAEKLRTLIKSHHGAETIHPETELFLIEAARAQQRGEVINAAGEELPKSFVLCEAAGRRRIYLSQLNSSTLLKRSESLGLE